MPRVQYVEQFRFRLSKEIAEGVDVGALEGVVDSDREFQLLNRCFVWQAAFRDIRHAILSGEGAYLVFRTGANFMQMLEVFNILTYLGR